MNKLNVEQRAKIINCLIEGCSMRATTRLTGAAKRTVERLLVEVGEACATYHDKVMRGLSCKVLQVDEIWTFTYCKEANRPAMMKGRDDIGDTWTWVAIDADTKLIPSYHVGSRDFTDASAFIGDLASRLAHRVQLTSDGHKAYLQAVEDAFGADIDYSMLIKIYGKSAVLAESRYSPPVCTSIIKRPISGVPDKALISTSFVERQNLTLRMQNRRFTRLTNAFSKKIENHKHMLAIHFMNYNFCRIHQTLRCTPAIEAGITKTVWQVSDMINLCDSK